MHWTERRRAQTGIGEELRRRGWTLYGWKDDKSDAMTDTYDPASWDGIAEKNGYVVVVDVSKSNSYVLSRSGGYQTQRRVRGDVCPHCQGSGKEPNGWTHEKAKAQPVEFNRSWAKGGVALLQQVVSSLMFDGDGDQKCTQCHGVGHGWKLAPVTEPWPVFQHNPQNKNWHVERAGRILASGVGLGPCADYDRQRAQASVEQLVDRIEAGCAPMNSRQAATGAHSDIESDVAATIRRNEAHNGIEVAFASKPPLEIRSTLKALGFRWSKAQGLWYARYRATTWQRVHALLEQELASAQEPQKPEPEDMKATPNAGNAPPQAETPSPRIEDPPTRRMTGREAAAIGSGQEPWQMTRLGYQQSRAATAGGVPILNARDGREHDAAVRQAVEQGLPVPPHVLAEYGLTQADILEVVDVYGHHQRISRHDYLAGYEQIRLYCDSTNTLLEDLPTGHVARQAQGGAITLHRDNIAKVVNVASPGNPTAAGEVDTASCLEPAVGVPNAEPSIGVLCDDGAGSVPSLPTSTTPAAEMRTDPEQPAATAIWAVLTGVKWKNGHPIAPGGIIEARNGDGQTHRLTPWGDGLWCMSCNSDACHAAEAVLATRPAAKTRQAQTP